MNKGVQIVLFLILSLAYLNGASQTDFKNRGPVLFTDRDYCVSGDTVWVKVLLPEGINRGNIIRVQLDGMANNLISSAALQNINGWSEGYIHVPDSLSTGQYFLSAFLNAQRNMPNIKIQSNSLIVYNRFEEQVNQVNIVSDQNRLKQTNFNKNVIIETDKNEYQQREEVKVGFDFNSSEKIKGAVVKIAAIDPLTSEIAGRYQFNVQSSNPNIPDFAEKDGIILSGKVVNSIGLAQPQAVVILSIADDPPYFDYYYTGSAGDFHFFLKNAEGLARIVLQVISDTDDSFFIRPEENYLKRVSEIQTQTKVLKPEQTQFVKDVITGDFMKKLFYPVLNLQTGYFNMPARFPMPFYGVPTKRVIPDEYIDLPDFREISRELLNGFQYRVKNDIVTFRMINDSQNGFFADEPLRLINGIPVFKNSLFADLKSTDIEYVDIIQKERIFGDLRFKGILSVSLTDKTNLWMAQQPGVAQFNFNCIQVKKNPGYLTPKIPVDNQPDIRQLYYWQILDTNKTKEIGFQLSDFKGSVEISIEGISIENEYFKASKIIEVK